MLTVLLSVGLLFSTGPDTSVDKLPNGWVSRLNPILQGTLGPEDAIAFVELASNRVVLEYHLEKLGETSRVGSLMKLVTAAALLASGDVLHPFHCSGRAEIGNKKHDCWKKDGHGVMQLERALVESCNLYFQDAASRLKGEDLLEVLRGYGFGDVSGYHAQEVPGRLPPRLGREATIYASIGDGKDVLVSGLQILRLMAVLSGEGVLSQEGTPFDHALRSAMVGVVDIGTAAPQQLGFRLAGKTGTSSRFGHWAYDGWFAGFFPADKPTHAFIFRKRDSTGKVASQQFQKLLDKAMNDR